LRRLDTGIGRGRFPEGRESFPCAGSSGTRRAVATRSSGRAPANGDRKLTPGWSPSPAPVGRAPAIHLGQRQWLQPVGCLSFPTGPRVEKWPDPSNLV
jgi:hypothetical protein